MVDQFLCAASVNFEKKFFTKISKKHFQKFVASNEESTLIKYQYIDIDYDWTVTFGQSISSKSTHSMMCGTTFYK